MRTTDYASGKVARESGNKSQKNTPRQRSIARRKGAAPVNGSPHGEGSSDSVPAALSDPSAVQWLATGAQVVTGTAADHHGSFELLNQVFGRPSYDAFMTSLEDPFYEPCDRLLVKRDGRVVAHLLTQRREMRCGQETLPVGRLSWLAVQSQNRNLGLGRQLVGHAEQQLSDAGALLAVLHTDSPQYFTRHGWVACASSSPSRCSTRDLLSRVSLGGRDEQVRRAIRPWRQMELPALLRVYDQNISGCVGALDRSEALWRWLIARRAFDQILVVTDTTAARHRGDEEPNIVGYAVIKQEQVLELAVDEEFHALAPHLLWRACGEAIESDHHLVSLHATTVASLHEMFKSETETRAAASPEVFMAKLLDPDAVLKRLRGEIHRRATVAELDRPCELGLSVDGRKWQIVLTRRSAKIVPEKLGRSYLTCTTADLTRLLLGTLDLPTAIQRQRVEASTRVAQQTAAVLFPRLPLVNSPLDHLME